MRIRIKFPEEILVSEGAEWVVTLPVVVGEKTEVYDGGEIPESPRIVAFTIELLERD